mgnify:CR=1 FL=1
MKKFSPEVCKKLNNYVYRLIDPRNGETFYIGKGVENRVFDHMEMQLKFDRTSYENSEDEVTEKFKILREIDNEGLEPIHIIHRHGMNEQEALEVEAALIDAFRGLSNIVLGHRSSEFGPANAIQLIKKYEAAEMEIPDDHKIIAINVNQTASDLRLIDAVRYAWKIDISKAQKADYIFAIKQGVCIGVFVAKEWLPATQENFEGFPEADPKRYGFNGDIANEEIKNMYVGKRLPKEMQRKKGMSNPIQYKNMIEKP